MTQRSFHIILNITIEEPEAMDSITEGVEEEVMEEVIIIMEGTEDLTGVVPL